MATRARNIAARLLTLVGVAAGAWLLLVSPASAFFDEVPPGVDPPQHDPPGNPFSQDVNNGANPGEQVGCGTCIEHPLGPPSPPPVSPVIAVIAVIGDPIAVIGDPIAVIGDPIAVIGDPIAVIGDPIAVIGDPIAVISQPVVQAVPVYNPCDYYPYCSPPPTPSAPTLTTPTPTLECLGTGWEATWYTWADTSSSRYDADWFAEWRLSSDPIGTWRSATVTASGNQRSVSGGPQPDQTVYVRIQGQAQRQAGNGYGWSGWSPMSSRTAWNAVNDTCPPPQLPTPTVTACRSTAGIEVEWTIPAGTWRTGTGWVMDVNIWLGGDNISTYLSAFSATINDLIPWGDRSITLAVPAGDGIQITMLAYDGTYGPQDTDTVEATPEPGCGPPAPPAAPTPTAVTLACLHTVGDTSAVIAEATWTGQPDTAVYEERYEVSWTVNGGTPTAFAAAVSPLQLSSVAGDDSVSVRVRAQARARANATADWSAWGAWSTAATANDTCPPTAPPPRPATPSSPAAAIPTLPVVTCIDNGSGGLEAEARWTGLADTDSYAEEYQVEWTLNGGTPVLRPPVSPYDDEPPLDYYDLSALAAGDQLTIRVRARASARTSATNIIGTTWSHWSPSGAWSSWSSASATATCPTPAPPPPPTCPTDPTKIAAVYPWNTPEPYQDANGNGSYDPGESFTDTDGNGAWTADLAGHPTGRCFPPGSACLPAPHGSGAIDVICLPSGS